MKWVRTQVSRQPVQLVLYEIYFIVLWNIISNKPKGTITTYPEKIQHYLLRFTSERPLQTQCFTCSHLDHISISKQIASSCSFLNMCHLSQAVTSIPTWRTGNNHFNSIIIHWLCYSYTHYTKFSLMIQNGSLFPSS